MNPQIPLRVLIIEDSDDDVLLLTRMLRRAGYDLVFERVQDAASMEKAIQTATWDIVISDYSLPNFDGMAALSILRESKLDIPFIIVSGVIGEETAVRAMKAGAHDYLMKGNLNRLLPAIEREIREAEDRRARRDAENNFRLLSSALAQSASLVVITNAQGIIIYVNQSFMQVTGFTEEDVLGQSWRVVKFDDASNIQLEDVRRAISESQPWRGELKLTTKSLRRFWAAVTVSAIKNENGENSQYLLVAEDITERKKLEEKLHLYNEQLEEMVAERTNQLRRAKEELEVILNTTSDAIALTLPNGDIQKTNTAFSRIFGDHVDKAIESLLWHLPDNEGMYNVGQAFLSVIYDQTNERIEAQVNTKDNQQVDVDIMFVPVPYNEHEHSGLVMSLRDITKIKDVERFKSQFVANATHDLSSPISVMKTRLYLLRQTPERLNEHVHVFEVQIKRLEHLVSELRLLSELDSGTIVLDVESNDINGLVADVVRTYQPIAIEKNQSLIFRPVTDLPYVLVDKPKIERVIVNLVINALNYSPSDSEVIVTSGYSSDYVEFAVQDRGMGIAQEDLPFIFERFYRTDRARESDTSGTGLGLAITKEMVELHGGTITVSSQIDIGTIFTVQLPRQ